MCIYIYICIYIHIHTYTYIPMRAGFEAPAGSPCKSRTTAGVAGEASPGRTINNNNTDNENDM